MALFNHTVSQDNVLGQAVANCPFSLDNRLGPTVSQVCRRFDFTLLFEQAFLSLTPSLLLVSLSIIRFLHIYRQDVKISSNLLQSSKWTFTAGYLCLQLAALVITAVPSTPRTFLSLATAAISLVASVCICLLSHFEHVRSVRPSILLNIYLFFSVLFDIVQIRTLWMMGRLKVVAIVTSILLVVKVVLLIVEAWEKGSILTEPYRSYTHEAISSIFNKSVFWWLNTLFLAGFRKSLGFDDLFPLDTSLSSNNLSARMQHCWRNTDKAQPYVLIWSVFWTLKWSLLAPVLPRLALIGFNYSQPFLINRLIKFMEDEGSPDVADDIAYGLIGAAAIIYTGIALSNGRYQHAIYRSLTKLRAVLSAMIFQKTLDLNHSALQDTASVTLMSTDVDSIVLGVQGLHNIWAGIIEVIIALYLLEKRAGLGCIAPILLTIAGTVGNTLWVGPEMKRRRPVWNKAVQERVSMTASFLKDMRSLKMMGLTTRMWSLLNVQRERELERSKTYRWMIIWLNLFANLMETFAKPFVLMAVTIRARNNGEGQLNASEAYMLLSLLSLISNPLAEVLALIPTLMGTIGLFGRIQDYLLSRGREDGRLVEVGPKQDKMSGIELHIIPKTASEHASDIIILDKTFFGYTENTPVLNNISCRFKAGSINMIIGPVGSGKTSLLLGILGEIPCLKGSVQIAGVDMAYCQQSTWLPNGTIRDIIGGTLPIVEPWYQTVMQACALDVDISRLPDRDQTLIGSRGVRLSGGQCQRLSLARAVYARKTVLLLDDVFSALDAMTEKAVFQRLFSDNGLLKRHKMTVILATHAVHHLYAADRVVALSKGGILLGEGSSEEVQLRNSSVKSLITQKGGFIPPESPAAVEGPDIDTEMDEEDDVEDDVRRRGDFSTYAYYVKSTGVASISTFFVLEAIYTSFLSIPELWVKWWTADHGQHTNMYISVMFVFACAAWSTNFASLWILFMKVIPRSAFRLHQSLLSTVCAAPLIFFSKTDAGMVLNRFSQDISIVDTQLPIAFLQLSHTLFLVIWNLALISYGSYYLAALLPVVAVVVYAIQKFYLRTSRQLRLLDLEMKSPLFTIFTESVEGLITIRAFGWQEAFSHEFLSRLDASQRPQYLLYMIQQWLGLCLSLVVAVVATVLVALATQLKDSSSSGALGVALVNVIGFSSNLAALVSHWTLLETSIGAISRLKRLEAEVKSEDSSNEESCGPQHWHDTGAVEFKNVSAAYEDTAPSVLNDITFRISPGEKIGICGRTGSGKSTLIGLLFRFVPVRDGAIFIGGINLSDIPRNTVRTSIIVIPQEPYILAGTVRFNANPRFADFDSDGRDLPPTFETITDDAIASALERVGLWSIIAARAGLDTSMQNLGLSHGQKQLFCLARAILRKHDSKLLVLDEATSSVDESTDEIMGEIIREEFCDHTVISVAHRLSSLTRCDRVVVMERGSVVEMGKPDTLARVKGGRWRELWEAQNGDLESPSGA